MKKIQQTRFSTVPPPEIKKKRKRKRKGSRNTVDEVRDSVIEMDDPGNISVENLSDEEASWDLSIENEQRENTVLSPGESQGNKKKLRVVSNRSKEKGSENDGSKKLRPKTLTKIGKKKDNEQSEISRVLRSPVQLSSCLGGSEVG